MHLNLTLNVLCQTSSLVFIHVRHVAVLLSLKFQIIPGFRFFWAHKFAIFIVKLSTSLLYIS